MKHWKSAILGMSSFLLMCWYFTSIVPAYEGEVTFKVGIQAQDYPPEQQNLAA